VNKGKEYTPESLMEEILRYKSYMDYSKGGVTFTGGEPLLQAEFILEVSKLCKAKGITVAIDTAGYILNDTVKELLEYTDLVLLDIKNYDPIVYKAVTGVQLSPTLKFLDYLREKNIPTWVRYVLVPQLTDNMDSISKLSDHLDGYPNVEKIELLAFHKMGEYKWKELGLDYKLTNTEEPSKELMEQVMGILSSNGKIVTSNL
jgi:pyruvate formate lyase activating enzyme